MARTSRYGLQRPASEKEASLQAALENAVAKLSNPVPTKSINQVILHPFPAFAWLFLFFSSSDFFLFLFLLLLLLLFLLLVVVPVCSV